ETRGIDGVDQQYRGIRRQYIEMALGKPGMLDRRAAIAFAAMGARHADQEAAGRRRAEPGSIRRQFLALRSAGGILMGDDLATLGGNGIVEFAACLRVAGRKECFGLHDWSVPLVW